VSKFIFYHLRWPVLATLIMFGSGSAQAAQPVNGSGAVAPDVLVNEVLEKNPELALYRSEIDAAKGARKTASALSNPEFSGSLGRKRVWDEEGELTGEGAAGEASVMQSLEWPGRIGLRRAIAERDIELAELGLEQFRAVLAGQAKSAIYDAAAAQELAAATREVADHFRSLREVLVQRDPAGLTPLLETRVIEAMELTMQRKAGEAAIAAQAALFRLNRLRGAAADSELSLDRLLLSFQPLKKDRRTLAALASANDLSVRLRELELARQGFRVDLAGNEQFGAVAVGPSFSQERAGDRERVIGAALSVPLPLWNQNQGNIEMAKAQKSQAETSLDIARHEAERRVIEAAVIYETRFKEMAAWRPDSVRHFKEAAELADRHYRLGAVPVSIYLELQTQYLEAVEGLQSTRREALEAALELELLTQTPLDLIGAPAGEEKQ
jgi:cobalt-zinc-cadmium efflux system outer membrane protein